jgi:hypothetical protein
MSVLSDHPEYMTAIPAFAAGDYELTRSSLETLISRLRARGESERVPYLLHVLGDVEAKSGNSVRGHSLHAEACELGGPHPFEHLMYATGLVRSFGEPALALSQLHLAEGLLHSGEWTESEDDMSREWYEEEIARLREEAGRGVTPGGGE